MPIHKARIVPSFWNVKTESYRGIGVSTLTLDGQNAPESKNAYLRLWCKKVTLKE